jgi:hypothetical protein
MERSDQQKLLVEYQTNVELWKHDDMFRLQRSQGYLTFNTILLVALGVIVTLKPSLGYLGGIMVLFAVFGVLVSEKEPGLT